MGKTTITEMSHSRTVSFNETRKVALSQGRMTFYTNTTEYKWYISDDNEYMQEKKKMCLTHQRDDLSHKSI